MREIFSGSLANKAPSHVPLVVPGCRVQNDLRIALWPTVYAVLYRIVPSRVWPTSFSHWMVVMLVV